MKYIYLWEVKHMVRSMTGYGVKMINIEESQITIEMKSVNHRFLDIKTNLPLNLSFIEEKIKRIIKNHFQRGRFEVYVIIDGDHFVKKTLITDWELMDQYVNQYELAKERYQLEGDLSLSSLSSLSGLFRVKEDEEQPSELIDTILESIEYVCKQVQDRRKEEGDNLKNDINNRITSVHNMLLLIKERRPKVISDYQERIIERLRNYTSQMSQLDDRQLHQEIALLAEKGDISEELTRLESHIGYFFKTIDLEEAVGRKLDFIIQEMHREINTVGSKSTDNEISQLAINIKSELEKIKEQIQNIE